jgi:FAD/FMN-containing dehydrogenase
VRRRAVEEWTNWSGNMTAAPREVTHPENVDQLTQLITAASQAGRQVKPVGAGHSFNSIACADGVQICLDRMTGLSHVDHNSRLVTVRGGTTRQDRYAQPHATGWTLVEHSTMPTCGVCSAHDECV